MALVRALLRAATSTLAASGVASPALDARLLLAHVLEVSPGALITVTAIADPAASDFAALLTRRAAREPLQHLIGTAPFRYSTVRVGPGVFIPRPETELLVDAVLPRLRTLTTPVVVDLCSGSGALALAIADEVPAAQVLAVERSPAAVRWLALNCAGTRVAVRTADITHPAALLDYRGRADAVLSNPPYVPTATSVGAEVAHDPPEAVFAGTDGLALMPAVIAAAAELLRSGGVLALEHDWTHGDAVPALLHADGRWESVADHRDLTGRDRYATAVRR